MSLAGKMTPLGVKTLNGLLQNTGLGINDETNAFIGTSTGLNYTKGTIINNCALNYLVDCTQLAYAAIGSGVEQYQYDSLLTIGSTTIPALGNMKPSTYSLLYTGEDTKFGFFRLLALQAHKEMNFASGSYSDFLYSFSACESFKNRTNKVINSIANSIGYLDGVYSNMDDLTTSDIAGVNLATLYWGQDLIRSGRAIDLKTISTFGNPINLLKTLQLNNAITSSVNLALLASGLSATEINNMLLGVTAPTVEQTRKVYGAFTVIQGKDLTDVLTPLNVQTQGLQMLADLLNPKMLFPTSYVSLTVPDYNVRPMPTNSKTYYPIYTNGAVNGRLPEYRNYLDGIVPLEIALACVAFSASMLQIKNISKMDIEKFSQVVTHLETTTGLGAVGGTTAPSDKTAAQATLSTIAMGTGPNNTYTTCDFFGAASGVPYQLPELYALLNGISSLTLYSIYQTLKAELEVNNFDNIDTLVEAANTEIANIFANDKLRADRLNAIWLDLGTHLKAEQLSRAQALPADETLIQTSLTDIYAFIDSVNNYALDTATSQSAQVLERLSDLTSIGGQSLVGMMREQRNAHRLGLAGGILDNDIADTSATSKQNNLGIPIVSGDSIVPGSLAGSGAAGLVPLNLDIFNISGAITPTVLTPSAALDAIIACNCDCWDM
jgi:hypothetical protein